MDQKKTLWIVTAAGFFLAVVVLAALILNKPSPTQIPSTASVTVIEKSPEKEATPIEQSESNLVDGVSIENISVVEQSENQPENQSEENPAENASVVIDLNQVNNVIIQSDSPVTPKNQVTAQAIENKKQKDNPTTIYTVSATEKAQSQSPVQKKSKEYTEYKNNKSFTYENKKNVTSSKKSYDAENYSPAKYWIQCASYTSKKTAEVARTSLDKNKIPVEVFTFKDNKNNLYYRVRVGPYTTKSEAEYWQSRIAKIDNFKNSSSYITVN